MALKALRDTYALDASSGTEVRRFIRAGTMLLPHYTPESEQDVVEDPGMVPLIVGNPAGSTPQVVPKPPPAPRKAEKK